jgi:hypothetical protein
MYRMSSEMSTVPFKNQRLIQVCFGPYDLILQFNETIELGISITSAIGTSRAGEQTLRSDDFKEHAATLLDCLDKLTTSAEVIDEKTLRIGFSNGHTLEMHDHGNQYESFVISYPGHTIVI